MASGWFEVCAQHLRSMEAVEPWTGVLQAFPGKSDSPVPTGGFDALLRWSTHIWPDLIEGVERVLSTEVDRQQALMFGRRLGAVRNILGGLEKPEATVLGVGLAARVAEMLRDPGPRAHRIRALADYYYSYAAVMQYRGEGGVTVASVAANATWKELEPGCAHARLVGNTALGPIHVNAIRISPRESGIEHPLETLDCRTETTDLAELVIQRGAIAAVSGGFFLYSEPDIHAPSQRFDPVGLLVQDGEIINPAVFSRASLVVDTDGTASIEIVGMVGMRMHAKGGNVVVSAINSISFAGPHRNEALAYNRAWGPRVESSELMLGVVGNRVVAVGSGTMDIPLAGVVLVCGQDDVNGVAVGDTVAWSFANRQIRQAMAGGPMLLEQGRCHLDLAREHFSKGAPPVTFSEDETFDNNLLPRLAVGITEARELVFVAVDGRDFHRAPGMTLRDTAALLHGLGCVTACNLDGGSSKRMVVGGRVVDNPSTEVVGKQVDKERVRPVHTAVLIHAGRTERRP